MKKQLLLIVLCGSMQVFAQGAEDRSYHNPSAASIAALPVLLDVSPPTAELELLSFGANVKGSEGVVVNWVTASERMGERFLLERSGDLMHWEIILEAPGDGGVDEITHYEVLDRKPLEGVSYYRLVQEENGEYVELSDLYSVRFDTGHDLLIQADHAPGRFVITANGEISELLLLNNRGQFVPMQLEHEGDRVRVHAELLANGTYYVQAVVNGTNVMRPLIIDQGTIIGG